ncbi:MAG: hypothetical protein IH995_01985 [Proteobacteria bacterium]|nr:hypothetical protein [Pseudomonadota bacterium]
MSDIEDIIERISELEKRVENLETGQLLKTSADAKPHPKKKESIKEFMLVKKPSNDVQKTLVVGYFLEKNQEMGSFNVDDLAKNFRLAKEPTPQNLNDKVNMNIKKGHMMEAKEKKENKKAWELTNLGEQFVEKNFKET